MLEHPLESPASAAQILGPLGQGREIAEGIEHSYQSFTGLRRTDLTEYFLLSEAQPREQTSWPLDRAQMDQSISKRKQRYGSVDALFFQCVQRPRSIDGETAARRSPQALQMGAATDVYTDIRRQGANVRSARTGDCYFDLRVGFAA